MFRYELPNDETTPAPAAAPASSAFEDLVTLMRLLDNPKDFQAKLDQLTAATVKANEAKAAAAKQEASLAARKAELDRQRGEIAEMEVALAARKARVDDQQARLHEIGADIKTQGNRFKREILRYAHVAEHFNERLQDLPDWDALARIALDRSDVHYGNDAVTVRDEPGDNEVPANLVAGSTLTRRGPRPPRPTRADAS
jgi:hypothetical protein